MGTTSTHLKISQNIQYIGQVLDSLPHGKGILIKSIIKQNIKYPYYQIKGQFIKGQLISCIAKKQYIQYQGSIKSYTFNGLGKIINKKYHQYFQGLFINGIIIKGIFNQNHQYNCNGQYKLIQQSKNNQNNHNNHNNHNNQLQQINLYQLSGKIQFQWTSNKQKISGHFINGQLQGQGIYQFYNGDQFTGHFNHGVFQGVGTYTSSSIITSITGNFTNSIPHSNSKNEQKHTIKFANGDIYVGRMKNGQMHDHQGVYTYKDGTIYRGSFIHNKLSGNCQITYSNQSQLQKYKGEISDGKYNGLGVIEYKNGIIFKGYFLQHCKNGSCIIIYGTKIFKCLYLLDQLIGDLIQIQNHIN